MPLGGEAQPQRHLGGIFVVQRGVPIQITVTNKLPAKHILPVDTSASFPDVRKHQNATTTHLHGGFTPWISDGGPFTWYTPDGQYGPSVHSAKGNIYQLLNPGLQPGQAEYYYPNNQSARLVWYHDHAHDLRRLNAYAGIASAYIIRDHFEAHLRNLGLPDFVEHGGREIPIVIQDKIFVGPDIATKDPTWHGSSRVGSLWYPHTYETDRWQLGKHPLGLPPDPSVIPEMFGDTMLANGTVYPEATVEARRYRLRIINACQARFLNLQLYVDDGSPDGITLDPHTRKPTNAPGPGGRPAQRLLPRRSRQSHAAPTRLRAEHPPDSAIQGRPCDQQGRALAHHRKYGSDAGPHPVPGAAGNGGPGRRAAPAAGGAGPAVDAQRDL
jgi:spore coat protein A